jgi:hypothetical protein
VNYKNGNVVCELLNPYKLEKSTIKVIEVPVYYCKFVSDDITSLPQNYKT